MKPKHSSLAALALASTVLLSSCGEPATDNDDTQAASDSTTITVYTSEPEEKVDEINAAFNEENPDIEVKVYRAGTGDLNARISSEKQSGDIEADVLWAADAPTFENYAEESDLIELADVDSNDIIDEAKDDENFYAAHASSLRSLLITPMKSQKAMPRPRGRISPIRSTRTNSSCLTRRSLVRRPLMPQHGRTIQTSVKRGSKTWARIPR